MDRYEIIWKCIQKQGYKYDYRKIKNQPRHSVGTFICDIHGEFNQSIDNHLAGKGCSECSKDARRIKMTKNLYDFLIKLRNRFGDEIDNLDFSKSIYVKSKLPMTVTCKIHGDFKISPNKLLSGEGCKYCNFEKMGEKRRISKEEFIKRAIKLNTLDNGYVRYEYDKILDMDKISYDTEVEIFCKKCKKYFKQTVNNHLVGKGCSHCQMSKMEERIMHFLEYNKINYIYLYRNKNILSKQSLDFYLEDLNVAIECQGRQHFNKVELDRFNFNKILERDIRKNKICLDNNIKLIYFTESNLINDDIFTNPIFQGIYNKENLIYDKDKLIEAIFKSS